MVRSPCVVIVVAGVLVGASAHAQPRSRWSYGASLGRGAIAFDCARCGELDPMRDAVSVSGYAARMVRPELALGVELWGVIWRGRDVRQFTDSGEHLVSHLMTTVSARAWLTQRAWLQAGVGLSHYDFDEHDGGTGGDPGGVVFLKPPEERGNAAEWAPAATAALGFDIVYTPELTLDLQFRAGAARHEAAGVEIFNSGLAIGASWF